MLKETIRIQRRKAIVLKVDLGGGGIEAYAMAWLKLTNVAREYSHMVWKIANREDDVVYVYANPMLIESVKTLCNGLYDYYDQQEDRYVCVGKVIDEFEMEVGFPVYEYDSTCKVTENGWKEDIARAIDEWMYVKEG